MTLAWSTDVSEGAWLVPGIRGFARDVGSVVPHGFDSYARLFHLIEDGPWRRWSELAAHNRRVAHREMQLHLIAHPPGEAPARYEPLQGMAVGSVPRPGLQVLADVLGGHTDRPECWVAVWDGYGQLHGSPAVARLVSSGSQQDRVPGLAHSELLSGPRLELPNREYLLLHGAVPDVTAAFDVSRGQGEGGLSVDRTEREEPVLSRVSV